MFPTHLVIHGLLGAVAITLGAQVSIPMVPIPTTLQTLAVVMIGLLAGPRVAGLAAGLYLLGVVVGLPVLASAQRIGGWAFFDYVGAGYVVGFVPGAVLAGWLGHGRSAARMVGAGLAAHGVVLACGVIVLAIWMGPGVAFERGLLPFLPGALVKSAVAAALVVVIRRRIGPS